MNFFRNIFGKIAGINKRLFDAAKRTRINLSFTGSSNNINIDIKQGLRVMRDRSKELAQNNPYIKKYCRTLEKYVIGPQGFTLRSKVFDAIDDKIIFNKKINYLLENEFWKWSKNKYCTTTGNMSLRIALGICEKAVAIEGEIFIKLVLDKTNPWGLTLQLIEPSLCDETLNAVTDIGNPIVMGIEYDEVKKPVAYYFKKLRKDFPLNAMYSTREYVRIEAKWVIHYFDMEWVGQMRGYPRTVQIANRLYNLQSYEENALVNAKSAAMKVAILEPKEGYEQGTKDINTERSDDEEIIVKNIAPGETYIVPDGYTYKQHDPTYPQTEHGPFTENMLTGISAGLDIDSPTLTANTKGTNYTSLRHGAIDSRLGYKINQQNIIEIILEPVYEIFLMSSILIGKIKYNISQIEYLNQPWFWGFTPGWVDPLKDKKAAIMGLQYKIDTYEDVLAEKGKDLNEHLDQLKQEQQEFIDRGLTPKINKFEVDNSDRSFEETVTEIIENYLQENHSNLNGNGEL